MRSKRSCWIVWSAMWLIGVGAGGSTGASAQIYGQSSAPTQERIQPRLSSATWNTEAESFRARGRDVAAPRDLVLWSYRAGEFSRVSTTRSRADGSFDFGEVGVSVVPLWLGVATVGQRPRVEDLLVVERPIPAPQIASTLGDGDGLGPELIVHPVRLEGELRVYAADDGRLLARLSLDATRPGATRIEPRALLGPVLPEAVWMLQVLEDGRISDRAYFRFDAAD